MPEITHSVATSRELADRLLADIQHRGLAAGDRYFTTEEVGRMLGVRKSTANRVMQTLADDHYLVRRKRSGTFVGPRIAPPERPGRAVVQVLLHPACGWGVVQCDALIAGLHDVMPGVSVQFTLLPTEAPARFVKSLLQEAAAAGWRLSLAPVSCPREVYALLRESKLPVVVLGSAFHDAAKMATVDADYAQAGRLYVERMVAHGCRRLALLTRPLGNPGEHTLVESMRASRAAARMPPDSLLLCRSPSAGDLFQGEIRRLMQDERPPTGLICRSREGAEAARRVLAELGGAASRRVLIVHESGGPGVDDGSPFPHLVRAWSMRETAALVGRLLWEQAQGKPRTSQQHLVPVAWCEPKLA